jgi:hypothetical protein
VPDASPSEESPRRLTVTRRALDRAWCSGHHRHHLGVPKVFPHASPRRVVQIGFLALFAGIVVMVALLGVGAGPEIVTWPMLLAGLGIGARWPPGWAA